MKKGVSSTCSSCKGEACLVLDMPSGFQPDTATRRNIRLARPADHCLQQADWLEDHDISMLKHHTFAWAQACPWRCAHISPSSSDIMGLFTWDEM